KTSSIFSQIAPGMRPKTLRSVVCALYATTRIPILGFPDISFTVLTESETKGDPCGMLCQDTGCSAPLWRAALAFYVAQPPSAVFFLKGPSTFGRITAGAAVPQRLSAEDRHK